MKENINLDELIERYPADDTGYVFDLDKTIIHTERLFETLCDATRDIGGDELAERLKTYNIERMKQGKNRPPFLPSEVLGDQADAVYQGFSELAATREETVYNEMAEFIKKVRGLGGVAVILTFAKDVEYQEAKLKAAFAVLGDELPYQIVGSKNKAKLLGEMLQDDGKYHFVDATGKEYVFTNLVGIGDEDSDFAMDGYDYSSLPHSMPIRRNGGGYYEEV